MGLTYEDFLDLSYEPRDADLVCRFRIEPAEDQTMESAASRVASESSNGTWAALDTGEDFTDMGATAFAIDGDEIGVAYPAGLFEPGNMPQILSCIAGNIMGMKAVETIRLLDCEWPREVVEGFTGPGFGSAVREEIFGVEDRPITATVPKPKVGLSTKRHAEVGYEAWTGGLDLLKDDENLTDQSFNPFADRLAESFDARDRAQEETGEVKSYLINVTADTQTMLERTDMVAEAGGEYVMVDVVTTGWGAVQTVRDRAEELGLAIHARRLRPPATARGLDARPRTDFATGRRRPVTHRHRGPRQTGERRHGRYQRLASLGPLRDGRRAPSRVRRPPPRTGAETAGGHRPERLRAGRRRRPRSPRGDEGRGASTPCGGRGGRTRRTAGGPRTGVAGTRGGTGEVGHRDAAVR
jgi:hypothetical protein